MKTGLILLQSIASSALRSSTRGPAARQWSESTARRSSSAFVHAGTGTGAAILATAAAGLVGLAGANRVDAPAPLSSPTRIAMCSNDNLESRGVAKTPIAVPSAPAAPTTTTRKKSIDEPDNSPTHNPLLPFPESSLRHDTYNGVTLDLTTLTSTSDALNNPDQFQTMLATALEIWSNEKRKGIWMKIPTTHSNLIASATNLGFDFQHAEPGYCVLTKWLPRESASRLPNGPTHQVGIGALVIHPLTGKMLAVQERTGPAAKRKLWKMPTGLTDPGEDIATAAVRELKEETGLDCTFDRIICFRQAHGGLFNRSDMFFVCLCKLAPHYKQTLQEGGEVELLPQEEEILMAEWMDMEEYSQQHIWRESPLYKEMNGAMLKAARRGIAYSNPTSSDDCTSENELDEDESHGFVAKNLSVGFRPGKNTIYVSSKL